MHIWTDSDPNVLNFFVCLQYSTYSLYTKFREITWNLVENIKYSAEYHVFPGTFNVISWRIKFLWDSACRNAITVANYRQIYLKMANYKWFSSEGSKNNVSLGEHYSFLVPTICVILEAYFSVFFYWIYLKMKRLPPKCVLALSSA